MSKSKTDLARFEEAQEEALAALKPRLIKGVLGTWPDCQNRLACNIAQGCHFPTTHLCGFLETGHPRTCHKYVPVEIPPDEE